MSAVPTPTLTPEGKARLQDTLKELAQTLPGCFLTVVTPTETLFNGWSGSFDMLDRQGRQVDGEDVMWFASTTKLLTAVCYLVLVDRGTLSLDTKMTDLYPPLKEASSRILSGVDSDGKPKLVPNEKPITLGQMLNQSSGFGMEFGETVQAWKKVTDKGKGFVNSCKVENLIHTPICYEPGTVFEYGNSAEWLSLILPTIVGMETEEFLQKEVLKPLGMNSTTYYPFGGKWTDKLMPLRFGRNAPGGDTKGPLKGVAAADSKAGDGIIWEELNGQLPLLTLPRTREEIENPAGGGGIYSKTSDYALLLQYLLRHYLSLSDLAPPPPVKILSDASAKSIFQGTLSLSALHGLASMFKGYWSLPESHPDFQPGEVDWSTAVAIYQPKNGVRREGWGRLPGSAGWGGAAGTEYWMDPKTGIACAFTTQMLPGRCTPVWQAKKAIERAIYESLA